MRNSLILGFIFALALAASVASADSNNAFTYQGDLQENGSPANGSFDWGLHGTTCGGRGVYGVDLDGGGTIGQHDAGPDMSGGNFELAGGFQVGLIGPYTVIPDSYSVTRGDYVSGGLPELSESDNMDLTIRRRNADLQSRTEFEIKSFSPIASPSSLEVTLEGSVFARSEVNQTIELFDYLAGDWEQVDTSVANRFSDITVTVAATGDLSRFVEPITRCIEARIRYQSVNPRPKFASNTDQFSWTINQ